MNLSAAAEGRTPSPCEPQWFVNDCARNSRSLNHWQAARRCTPSAPPPGRSELPGPSSQAGSRPLLKRSGQTAARVLPSPTITTDARERGLLLPRMAHRLGQGSSAMESCADRYRRLATDDQLRALRTNDPSQKRAFEEAAREWLTLADDVERMETLRLASAVTGRLGASRK